MTANDRPVVTRKGSEHGNTLGFRSLPHHHGEAETGADLLSGCARIYFGTARRLSPGVKVPLGIRVDSNNFQA